MLGIPDCIADRVWLAIPQPTKRQYIGNQIRRRGGLYADGLRKRARLSSLSASNRCKNGYVKRKAVDKRTLGCPRAVHLCLDSYFNLPRFIVPIRIHA